MARFSSPHPYYSQIHYFVMTGGRGTQMYGVCLTIHEPFPLRSSHPRKTLTPIFLNVSAFFQRTRTLLYSENISRNLIESFAKEICKFQCKGTSPIFAQKFLLLLLDHLRYRLQLWIPSSKYGLHQIINPLLGFHSLSRTYLNALILTISSLFGMHSLSRDKSLSSSHHSHS